MMKMDIKKVLGMFVGIFVFTLLVSTITTYIYSLIAYGIGAVDWETSLNFAIIFGIILTWTMGQENNKKQK